MQDVSRIELSPGVGLTCIQTKKFKSSFWSLRLILPLKKETAAFNAVLPRVLRRGTVHYPTMEQLSAALDELYGGVIEPTVTKRGEVQSFGFVATFLDDGLVPDDLPLLDRAARMMGDLLLRPATKNGRLRNDYVVSERKNLMDDIRSAVNDKRQYARQRLTEEMCAGEAYGVDRLGDLSSAKKIGVVKLTQHYRQVLSTARVEAYYCGSADPKRVEQAWREALMELPRSNERCELSTDWRKTAGDEVRRVTEHLDVTQGKLVMGFRTGCTLNSMGYPAMVVANAIFGGLPTSKLFQNVRERLSLCYYASSVTDKHKGLLFVQSGMKFEDFEQAETEILAQLEAVREGDFSESDLQAAKDAVSSTFRTILDSQSAQEDYWLSQAVSELKLTPQEISSALEHVTREDVMRSASQWKLDTVYYLKGLEQPAVETAQVEIAEEEVQA